MEVIAMGEMREFLQKNLPKFEDPVIFIISKFIPGCPKCNSSTSVYYITLTERDLIQVKIICKKLKNISFPSIFM